MFYRKIRSAMGRESGPVAVPSAHGKPWLFTLTLLWAATCTPAVAISLATVGPLPGAVTECLAGGACSIAQDSSFELGGIVAFQYPSPDGDGYLLRYPVLAPSLARDSQDILDNTQEPPLVQHLASQTVLSGSLWLAVQARYASSAADHGLQLYVDQVQPAEQRLLPRFQLNGPTPTVLHFGLTSDALLAAQAYRYMLLDPIQSVDEGSLQSAEPLLPCVADGCSVAQSLALIGIGFTAQGEDLVLHFVPQDRRRALYGEEIAYNNADNGFRWRRDYFVQPVPLPGAGVLTLSGVALLLPLVRRSRWHAHGGTSTGTA